MIRILFAAVLILLLFAQHSQAQLRTKAARAVAEALFEQFGSKVGRSVPEITTRLEGIGARCGGDEAIMAIRKGGPAALGLVEAAGADGAKAIRVLAAHGEKGVNRVLSKPTAMKQFLTYGDEAATVLVRHPGIAEPLVERGGAHAVKALSAVTPQNGRRLAMLMEGELANAAHHPELLGVVAKHGDSAMNFIWQNKATLAGGAALAAFLANPEPYLNGAKDLVTVAGETVVKPIFTLLDIALVGIGLILLAGAVVMYKHGLPKAEHAKLVFSLLKK